MPEPKQVPRGDAGTLELVDRHRRRTDAGIAAHDDQGYLVLDAGHRIDHGAHGGDDDDPFDVGRPKVVEGGCHVLPGAAQRDETQKVAGCPCRRLNAEEHVRRAELLGLHGDDPQRPRSPARENSSGGVGVVPEGNDGVLDPTTRRIGDAGEPAEHPGHGHDRHAGPSGDVGHQGARR